MKRLIALILLAPVVASAQWIPPCTPSELVACGTLGFIFAGSVDVTDGATAAGNASSRFDAFGGLRPDAPFYEMAGTSPVNGFPAVGLPGIGLASPIPYGSFPEFGFFENSAHGLVTTFSIDGFPWQGFAIAGLQVISPNAITHAGTYPAVFNFVTSFTGQPTGVPDVCSASRPCIQWQPFGTGVGSFYVSDYPGQPNTFYVTGGHFIFTSALPEPSTASLLLLGVAGLAVLGSRRKSRVTLLSAD